MVTANSGGRRAERGVRLDDLLAETGQYLAPGDLERIRRAYELAEEAHRGVLRRSGEPYISHPLEVALLLADMRIDADGIVAGLLHDVVEDTNLTLEDVRGRFGAAVADIVDGVTKFDVLAGRDGAKWPESSVSLEGEQAEPKGAGSRRLSREQKRRERSETVRKMLLATAEDPRVVVLKLADRLHNMRTLGVMEPAQQENKARETREIYAPLARRLGMALVQAELEDLAFRYLEPERFANLSRLREEELRKREPRIERVCRRLTEEMEKAGITAEVEARPKHLASIARKLEQGGTELGQIHDLVSYRILVETVQECYLALGHIHALWRPKDGRIKDFIATPKVNGYQSLHTTVFGLENSLVEVQIRTHEMERIANYGIASYWYLKERREAGEGRETGRGPGGGARGEEARLSTSEMIAWIEQLREWQRELPQNADEFVEAVKGDMFEEQIFVFTPKGEVKELPRGSTPLDLAYRIHTDIGDHCVGARIIMNIEESGRLITRVVPPDYELKGGEIVDVLVSPEAHPSREWLSFARTSSARAKIRRYLKTYEREVNLQLGRERLDLALKAAGAAGLRTIPDVELMSRLDGTVQKKYSTADDVYVALGRDELAVSAVMERLLPGLLERGEIQAIQNVKNGHHQNAGGVDAGRVGAIDALNSFPTEVVIKQAHCCYPLPGDVIVGVVHPNKGIVVHRSDCRTLRRSRDHTTERLLEMNWLAIDVPRYSVPIILVAHDRAGLLRDVAGVVADAGINMTSVTSTTNASLQKARITATLEIEAVEQIAALFERLQQIPNVVSVRRDLGRGIHA